jgi:hypothetical protein
MTTLLLHESLIDLFQRRVVPVLEARAVQSTASPAESLLELLAALTKLRCRVFALERWHTPTAKQNVAAIFRDVQSRFEEFGEHGWGEEEAGRSFGLFGGRSP